MNKLRTHAPFGNSPTRLKDVKTTACASCYGTGFDVMGKPCSCKHLYIESDNMGTQVVNEQSYVTRITSLESHNRDLLAANQVMREALQCIIEHEEMYSEGFKVKGLSSEALLNADNSTLVNVGYLSEDGLEVFLTMGADINPWSCGEPVNRLYTIQTKSNTE